MCTCRPGCYSLVGLAGCGDGLSYRGSGSRDDGAAVMGERLGGWLQGKRRERVAWLPLAFDSAMLHRHAEPGYRTGMGDWQLMDLGAVQQTGLSLSAHSTQLLPRPAVPCSERSGVLAGCVHNKARS